MRDVCKIWLGDMEFKVMAPFSYGTYYASQNTQKVEDCLRL